MESFLLILKFFGGLVLLFGIGKLIGHLLKLNQHYEDQQSRKEKGAEGNLK